MKDGFCVKGTCFFHCKHNKVYTFISRLKAKPNDHYFLPFFTSLFLYMFIYKFIYEYHASYVPWTRSPWSMCDSWLKLVLMVIGFFILSSILMSWNLRSISIRRCNTSCNFLWKIIMPCGLMNQSFFLSCSLWNR